MIKQFTENYLKDLNRILRSLPLDKFEEIVNLLIGAYNREAQIFIMGNGGSAATAAHFACDINKGVSFNLKKRFKVICLNDNIPTMLAYANDNAYNDIFVEQLKNFLKPRDIVIGISGSGNSENVIKAIQYANKKSAKSIAFTGFKGGRLARIAKTSVIIPAEDMQKIEDAHLILMHIIMQILYKSIGAC